MRIYLEKTKMLNKDYIMRAVNNSFKPKHNLLPIVMFLLLLSLSLFGCSKDLEKEDQLWFDYIKERTELEGPAIQICKSHGQTYLNHYYDGFKWEVCCYQASPLRHFYWDLG